jgi:5-methylcytosine-specific restriction endonuclease McrA
MPYRDVEAEREYHRAYYRRRQEELRQRAKEYYERNREDKLEYAKEYQQTHPEVHQRANQRYQQFHRLERRAMVQNYRTRKRNQFVEKVDLAIVWARDEGICGICQEAADQSDWHLDHIQPLSKGGEHSYRNTQVSHPVCNLRKGAGGACDIN